MSKDPKMNIRRLAIVFIGLIGGKKACEPLCEALKMKRSVLSELPAMP